MSSSSAFVCVVGTPSGVRIADEKERRLLEEQLEKRIKESWRYAPSLTPEGVPTTQTKAEELDIPERKQPKDVRQDVPGLR